VKRTIFAAAVVATLAACDATDRISHGPVTPTTLSSMQSTTATKPAAGAPASNLEVWVDDLDLSKATQGWNETYKNESAEHNPVTLKDKTFKHAVGTHANGLIVIDLKGAAKSFSATVGVDDDALEEGSVGFTVIGDGKVLARTGTINRGDPVKKIAVDLTGVQQLVLQCDSGDDDSINNDHADWAEPLITLDPVKAAGVKIQTVAADLAKLPK